MIDQTIKGLILFALIYSVAAVISFVGYFSPFPKGWSCAIVWCTPVSLPYILLFVASHLSIGKKSKIILAIATGLSVSLAFYLYSGSFGYNDGEYIIAYMLVPAIQAPLVLIALGFSLWSRKYVNTETT